VKGSKELFVNGELVCLQQASGERDYFRKLAKHKKTPGRALMDTLNKKDVLNRNEGSDAERSRGKIFKTMLEKEILRLSK